MVDHVRFMNRCLELAHRALESGNPPVGSILVRNDRIVGKGMEAGKTYKDITYHAEIEAIRNTVNKEGTHDLSAFTLYTTHEPCIMCSYVIRHHKIGKIVMGIQVPYIGGMSSSYPILTAADIPIWGTVPEIIEGVLSSECQKLNKAFQHKLNQDKL